MEELVKRLQDKVGLEPEKAQQAAMTALGFIKDKLPGPLAEQVEKVLAGGPDAIADLADKIPGGVGDALGGLLGGKKD